MLFDFLSRGVKFTDPKGRFNFNTRTGIAKVNGDVTEKYARKLLQDALKEKTPYKGGWYITFRDFNKNKDADGQYDFEISNIFASNMKVNV